MAHNKHVIDGVNKDVGIYGWEKAREYYLSLAETWTDPYPDPVVTIHDDVRCVRDDLITGTKVRGGDCLLSKINQSTIVYVQPRTGLAGVSLLDVAKRHNKKVKLFMPSSQTISHHQACCIEQGADVEFHRIAAMPNLNKIAKDWADSQEDAFFVPVEQRLSQSLYHFNKARSQRIFRRFLVSIHMMVKCGSTFLKILARTSCSGMSAKNQC